MSKIKTMIVGKHPRRARVLDREARQLSDMRYELTYLMNRHISL